ncbi:Alpha/Beta hydrolase protein [Schizothecium vesticola]|uniref:Alpha/Beta hydrolase protein n=1 Tax=Schizothecium vesticola TaxID=314040 RepID=A0AA40K0J5_9PEZI|nr:Alpha/Beta hydrolase protein [Schizothecium vesticola]
MPPFPFSTSFMFDFELTRLLGSASSSGCEIGEFKSGVGALRKHDPESWHTAWLSQAERALGIAHEAACAGYRVPARNAFLRASNYLRAAGYMFGNDDARVLPLAERSVAAFGRAAGLMEGMVRFVEVPFEDGVVLTGWLCLPAEGARLEGGTPVVVYAGGADATKEELWFLYGHTGPLLGYAVLCLEGPGQGMLLKRDRIPLRPDFEVVAGCVLDYLGEFSKERPECGLDMEKVAVAGAATGGYFALRAATDKRIKACVAVDPFFSMWELAMSRAPERFMRLWDSGWIPDSGLDTLVDAHCRSNFQAGWEMSLGKSSMGCDRPSAMLRRFKDFSLDSGINNNNNNNKGKILDRVTCPVFLTGPGAETVMYSSADESTMKIDRLLVNVPAGKKEVWVPKAVEEGGLTAKIGAWALLAQKTFIFLDKHFEIRRPDLGEYSQKR